MRENWIWSRTYKRSFPDALSASISSALVNFPADGVHQIVPLSFLNFTNNYSKTGYFNICDKINTIFFKLRIQNSIHFGCAPKQASLKLLPLARCSYLAMTLNGVEATATFNR